ncbi:MAG: site-specific integrase [Gammaproteobacteria bacterium]|nr:site-specific integrase [Gammaproteobacteria bacterium]
MEYGVETFKNDDNNLCVDLVYKFSGLPKCFWITAFLAQYNNFRTALTYAYQAKFFSYYFDSIGIDIPARVKTGSFLSSTEIENYIHHCLFKGHQSQSTNNVVIFNEYSTKSLSNLIHSSRSSQNRVSTFTTKIRLKAFQRYLKFLFQHIYSSYNYSSETEYCFKDNSGRIDNYIKKLKHENTVTKDQFEQAIPTHKYLEILQITHPSNLRNPWTQASRIRNYLIIKVLTETGIRVGALCKLKISDLITSNPPRINITRTPNDPNDPRKRPPAQKTLAHVSPISSELMKSILMYIKTERAKHGLSISHDFIFIAEKGTTSGQPISIQAVQKLFTKLSNSINFRVYPHLIRHKFQELFEDAAISKGVAPSRIDDLRKYASGWSANSKMIEVYNEHKLALAAHEISKSAQKNILSGLNYTESTDET